jgi:hypothetical protein
MVDRKKLILGLPTACALSTIGCERVRPVLPLASALLLQQLGSVVRVVGAIVDVAAG